MENKILRQLGKAMRPFLEIAQRKFLDYKVVSSSPNCFVQEYSPTSNFERSVYFCRCIFYSPT